MRSSSTGAIPSDLGALIDTLNDFERRLRLLEAPSGESLSATVAKLQALVEDIQAQLDAWVASRYDNATIDAKDAAVAAMIGPAVATRYDNATVDAKDAAVNANILPTIAANNVTVGGAFLAPNAYATDITWTRRTAWWGNDGRAGYASSSARKKTAIEPADVTRLLRLLDVEPKSFYYRAEIARRTTKRINESTDYMPARELGLIAEELDAIGLSEFVYYDEDGQPEGIEYAMLVVALLAIARAQRAEIAEIRGRVERLES